MNEEDESEKQAADHPVRKLKMDISELESAFDLMGSMSPDDDEIETPLLDLSTGEIISVGDAKLNGMLGDGSHLALPDELFESLTCGKLDEFVATLTDETLRHELKRITRGKGAFRRFNGMLRDGANNELKHRWFWFETCLKRQRIIEWLEDHRIEVDWGHDIFEAPPLPDKRSELLSAVLGFVREACRLPGVRRMALLGSLTTPKRIPKDVDLLVEVSDDMPLDQLARLSRKLSGKTMATGDGCGADVFVCDPQGEYLGRICLWKKCAPGIRQSCQAQHCGRRSYLSDDLQVVKLEAALIAAPPLDLWPEVVARVELPEDLRKGIEKLG